MTKNQFKETFFTDNFYWVNKENYQQLQNIGVEFGCLNPNGDKSIIEWHEGFKNLGFRTYDDKPTKFQKEPFLIFGNSATSFEEMINEYQKLEG